MQREYVIVCNVHKGIFDGALLFWGHKTEDRESRSFGGYTNDIDKCEVYTLEEIEQTKYGFPVYHDGMSFNEFKFLDDVVIKKSDLMNFKELREMHVVFRA